MKAYEPTLKKLYKAKIAAELKKEFGYTSSMEVPGIEKVSVSVGVGETIANKKLLEAAVKELGRKYRDTILALGGSKHPSEVYKMFRGRDATTESLLRHNGLTAK